MEVLAQAATDAPTLPPWQWWASFGVLGIGGFIGVCAFVAWFFGLWLPHKSASYKQDRAHQAHKQQVEAKRDETLTAFISHLADTRGEEMEHKRRQTEILDRMDKRQAEHSDACQRSEQKLERLGELIGEALRTRTA